MDNLAKKQKVCSLVVVITALVGKRHSQHVGQLRLCIASGTSFSLVPVMEQTAHTRMLILIILFDPRQLYIRIWQFLEKQVSDAQGHMRDFFRGVEASGQAQGAAAAS